MFRFPIRQPPRTRRTAAGRRRGRRSGAASARTGRTACCRMPRCAGSQVMRTVARRTNIRRRRSRRRDRASPSSRRSGPASCTTTHRPAGPVAGSGPAGHRPGAGAGLAGGDGPAVAHGRDDVVGREVDRGLRSPLVLTQTSTPSGARTRAISSGNSSMLMARSTCRAPSAKGSRVLSHWRRGAASAGARRSISMARSPAMSLGKRSARSGVDRPVPRAELERGAVGRAPRPGRGRRSGRRSGRAPRGCASSGASPSKSAATSARRSGVQRVRVEGDLAGSPCAWGGRRGPRPPARGGPGSRRAGARPPRRSAEGDDDEGAVGEQPAGHRVEHRLQGGPPTGAGDVVVDAPAHAVDAVDAGPAPAAPSRTGATAGCPSARPRTRRRCRPRR